jgi:hypothetical protein
MLTLGKRLQKKKKKTCIPQTLSLFKLIYTPTVKGQITAYSVLQSCMEIKNLIGCDKDVSQKKKS